MKSYTVKQLSEILETNPETIRRWIKSGQLEATQSSRKEGNVITEESLQKFVEKKPKYAEIIAGAALMSLIPLGGIVAAPLVASALIGTKNEKENNKELDKETVVRIINNAINDSVKKIQSKQDTILKMQKELEKEQEKISKLQSLIKDERGKTI